MQNRLQKLCRVDIPKRRYGIEKNIFIIVSLRKGTIQERSLKSQLFKTLVNIWHLDDEVEY